MPKHAIAAGTALALVAGPAMADLSAQDVWADWQRVYASLGSPLTAEARYEDGRLTLSDVTTVARYGDLETRTAYGTIVLVERADGTLAIEVPARVELVSTTTLLDETQTQTIVMESEGLEAIAREEGDVRTYDIDAARIVYTVSDDGAEVPATATVTLTATDSSYVSTTAGEIVTFEQSIAASDMAVAVTAGGEEPFDMTYLLTGLAADMTGTIDLTARPEMPALSQMGIAFTGAATHSGSETALSVMQAESGPFSMTGTSEGGRIGFALGEDALTYDLASTGAEVAVQLAAFPLPIDASLAEFGLGFALPVGVSEEAKPFGIELALRDLVLDDALWGLFDPTGQLPRDAATLLLELDGTAVMNADIFGDPEAMAGLTGAPGELKSMELVELLVSLAGAELRGEGAVAFPIPSEVPMPVGTVTLALDGGLALVDRLVALGFVPQQQAAFAKGMVGMVAQTVGEDQLRSVIEFTEGGGITANGMPLR